MGRGAIYTIVGLLVLMILTSGILMAVSSAVIADATKPREQWIRYDK